MEEQEQAKTWRVERVGFDRVKIILQDAEDGIPEVSVTMRSLRVAETFALERLRETNPDQWARAIVACSVVAWTVPGEDGQIIPIPSTQFGLARPVDEVITQWAGVWDHVPHAVFKVLGDEAAELSFGMKGFKTRGEGSGTKGGERHG